jgi:hypothetical protein
MNVQSPHPANKMEKRRAKQVKGPAPARKIEREPTAPVPSRLAIGSLFVIIL